MNVSTVKRAFRFLDEDGSGEISRDEFREAYVLMHKQICTCTKLVCICTNSVHMHEALAHVHLHPHVHIQSCSMHRDMCRHASGKIEMQPDGRIVIHEPKQ